LLALNHPDPETLEQDSEAVLKAIEVQHGLLVERAKRIYSFSHLTFHEYFQAKAFIANFKTQDLPKIRRIITKKSWREVFLLAADMLPTADDLLRLLRWMKQAIDELVAPDDKLQQFLAWVNRKSQSVEVPSLAAAVRAFYFNLVLRGDPSLVFALDSAGVLNREPVLDRERNLVHDLALALARDLNLARTASFQFGQSRAYDLAHDLAHDLEVSYALDLGFTSKSLQQLREQLPNIKQGFDEWWQSNGEVWTQRFYDLIIHDLETDPNYLLNTAHEFAYALTCDPKLADIYTSYWGLAPESIQQLKKQLPTKIERGFDEWWQSNGEAWTGQLRSIMIKHRNIGHDWQFSPEQKQLLKNYYNANSLLVECMNIASHITPDVREAIEDTLLLSVNEIDGRKALGEEMTIFSQEITGNKTMGHQDDSRGGQRNLLVLDSGHEEAITIWQEKLAAYRKEEAIAADPEKNFQLKHLIHECQQKIEELGG
jgi:predicted NACHT family NTPase